MIRETLPPGICPLEGLREAENALGARGPVTWTRVVDVVPGFLRAAIRFEAAFPGIGGHEFAIVARLPTDHASGTVEISYGASRRQVPLGREGELAVILAREIGGALPLYSERFLEDGRKLLERAQGPWPTNPLDLNALELQELLTKPSKILQGLQSLLGWARLMEAAAAPTSFSYLYELIRGRLESMKTAILSCRALDQKALGDMLGLLEAMRPYIK